MNISYDFTSQKTVTFIYNIKADGKVLPSLSTLVDYEAVSTKKYYISMYTS